jgi:hypothetical protein
MQRPKTFSCLDRRVRPIGSGERLVTKLIDNGIDFRIDRIEAVKAALNGLAARDTSCSDRMRQFSPRPLPQ